MRANIVLDDNLIKEALDISYAKSTKELLDLALKEYVKSHQKKSLLDLKAKIQFSPDYDYKKMRENFR